MVTRRIELSAALSLLFVTALAACSETATAPPTMPTTWTVHIASEAPRGVRIAADDVVAHLAAMGQLATLSTAPASATCVDGSGTVVFLGDSLGEPEPALATDQTFSLSETRCDGGTRVVLAGGGLLGRQYAAYEWLHTLGVRFFHPEETYIPQTPRWPELPVARTHTPAFRWRSVSLHLTHPLELGDAFRLGIRAYVPEALRYIDWTIRNGASRGLSGVGGDATNPEVSDYGATRGFPRETGFSLHNQQQGGTAILDPDDPRTEEEQLAAAIDERLGGDPATRAQFFGFTFNPSEFTEIPDTDAVRQITYITRYITDHYPGVQVETINHGTRGEPTATYDVRFYDLSQFAPPELGVKVHTLMFYDLFRPAPVYGNTDFAYLHDFMVQEYTKRRLVYFPEAAWWLTFDIAVPLYLPVTIEARDRDIQGLRPLLAGKLDGHHTFGTGHEWGYWQNEYCSLHLAMDVDERWQDCLRDITSPLGGASSEVQSVLEDLVALQERDFITGWQDTLAYLVGTDPETEVAASVGIEFHPLPPTPSAIARWDAPALDAWEAQHLPALQRMDADYAALVTRLRSVEADVPGDGRPWFDEIVDGVAITGLRARHAWQAYGAAVKARRAVLSADPMVAEAAQAQLADAIATTEAATRIVRHRESQYRYAPLARSIAGGPAFDEDANWTVYGYRYLAKTHHVYYWARIDRLVSESLSGGGESVRVVDAVLAPAEACIVEIADRELTESAVDWGDGSAPETMSDRYMHGYGSAGIYPLRVTAMRGVDPFELAGPVASVTSETRTGFSGVVREPMGVSLIEGVFPSLSFGPIDAARFAVGFSPLDTGEVPLGEWTEVALDPAAAVGVRTLPATLRVPIVNRGTGTVSAHIVIENGTLEHDGASTPVYLRGDLSTDAVVEAIIAVGGFEAAGARRLVASTLGYTVDTLPPTVSFVAEYAVSAL